MGYVSYADSTTMDLPHVWKYTTLHRYVQLICHENESTRTGEMALLEGQSSGSSTHVVCTLVATPVPGDLKLSSGLHGYRADIYIHTVKTPTHIETLKIKEIEIQ